MKIGILTAGGDCPGLNAVIRAIVRKAERHYGDEVVGFLDAWDGVMERRTMPLTVETMRGTLPRGGTVLGTRRGSPFDHADGVERVQATMADMGLDGLIVIGGNGSLTVSSMLHEQAGLNVVGVPKTIDNDIEGTDITFGFNTAVQIATDAIDRLHTTAESHDRVMVVEVMGRHSGWIATYAGIAGGATVVLIPERPFDIEEVCDRIMRRHQRGRFASIVVVAEGARLNAEELAHYFKEHREELGFALRVITLGHVQRGGQPGAFDRILATRLGAKATEELAAGRSGVLCALNKGEVITLPLAEVVSHKKTLDPYLFELAGMLTK